jgi:DNA-binding response OmpR family regulator
MPSVGSILIIDQEPTIVALLVEILTDAGYVAYSAPDGTGALTAIAHLPPALVILDMGHPSRRGAELLEAIRAVVLATTPIVVMTTEPCDAAPLLALGAIACLAKPFDLNELLACVARTVQPAQVWQPTTYDTNPTAAAWCR